MDWGALRQFALDRDTTVQALMIEAANDLLRKYRRRPVAETAPRSQRAGGSRPKSGFRGCLGRQLLNPMMRARACIGREWRQTVARHSHEPTANTARADQGG